MRKSDDWDFPTHKFATIGLLGRVHRGTPWQTVYMKDQSPSPASWKMWSLTSYFNSATNDWRIFDLFTAAPTENSARGLLSVNQTNLASWSAVLSGVIVASNTLTSAATYQGRLIDRASFSPAISNIVQSINDWRLSPTNHGYFHSIGDILGAPQLTTRSPFLLMDPSLGVGGSQSAQKALTDEAIERIPEQIMSLLKKDEPRYMIYTFGQSLKPAANSLYSSGGVNVYTNYQITGEVATRTLFRIDSTIPQQPKIVIEDFKILPGE